MSITTFVYLSFIFIGGYVFGFVRGCNFVKNMIRNGEDPFKDE